MQIFSGFLCICILVLEITSGTNGNVKTQRFTNFGVQQKIWRDLLNSSYDSRIPPFDPHGAASQTTITTVNMYIRSIDSVDDINRELNVQVTYRMKWRDERLIYSQRSDRHNFPYISTNYAGIWIPDIFFANEKKGRLHDIIVPNVYIRIYPDGEVLYSLRVSLSLRCNMNFRSYPFDKQNCSIRLASYGKTVDNLVLVWKPKDPVQVGKDVELPVFQFLNHTTSYCNSETETGVYSCLNVAFFFKRKFNSYLIKVFIPLTMLVIVAWLTLWMTPHGIFGLGRILIETITLFIMASQIEKLNRNLPLVSYTRAIDVWTGICMTFVFITFCVSITVQYLGREQGQPTENEIIQEASNKSSKKSSLIEKVDFYTRIIYPILFLAFIAIYVAAYAL